VPTTQLDTFSTSGFATYTIPSWAYKLDVISLGAGGGGQGGGAGFANGRAGAAGTYGAGLTLTRGVDFPWDKTTFKTYVGTAGAGGISGNGTAGGASALAVEYGAVGPGATGSGTGSVALSWTHTPNGYDNYVIVSVAATVAGGSFSTHTRAATYDGVAMTSLGVINTANSTGGWVQSFGIAVTPGAGAKTVAVTVSKAAAVYSSVKANSVSYGNVDTATVSATSQAGNNASPSINGGPGPGGVVVGSITAATGSFTAVNPLYASRFLNATAPAFLVLDGGATTNNLPNGISAGLSSSALWGLVMVSLAPRAAALGGGGAANSITWVAPPTGRGGSPGNKTFNGQTYVGGTGSLNTNLGAQPAAATAPGAGGGGSGGFLLGLIANGGSGSAGRVWIFSYAQFADASRSITTALTSDSRVGYGVTSTTLANTATATSDIQRGSNVTSLATAITATTTSDSLRNIPSSTAQSETATTTSAGLRNAIVGGSVSVVAGLLPCLILGRFRPQSSLSASATGITAGRISGQLNSPLTVTADRPSVVRWAALFSASQAVNFSPTTDSLRNVPTQVSLPVTATRNAVANFSTQLATSTPVTDTTSSAARLLAVASAPRTISCALTADSLRLARVDVAQTITATRDSVVQWDAYFEASGSITSTSSPILTNSTTIVATTLPGFPYYLPIRFGVVITASFTGFITRLQFADAPRSITADRPSNANAAFRLSSSLSIVSGLTTVANSNQPTQSLTLAITSNQSSTALRRVFASTSLASTATTSSASMLTGRISTATPTIAFFPTSASAILLLTKLHIITASRTADALKDARTNTALTVAADRPSNVKWDSKTNSATAAITATGSAYAVCSTTIVATTLPGFPYYLPMSFGVAFSAGISATASNRFTAPTIPTAVIAAVSAAPRAGWSATPSLAVAFGASLNSNVAAAISANANASVSSVPDSRKNIFISAINATITNTASALSVSRFLGSASIATTATTTAENRLATVISSQTNITSTSSPSSLRTVRVSPSLSVSGTLTAVANYRTTFASSRAITSLATGNLNLATTISATTLPGFPYELPYCFGVTFKASLPTSMAISYRIAAALFAFSASVPNINARWSTSSSLAITSFTDYPGLPYEFPFLLGRLNTTANTSTLIQASRTVTAGTSSSHRISALLSGTLSVFSGRDFFLLRDARVASEATALTAVASGNQRLGGFISSNSLTSSIGSANSRASMSFSASFGATSLSSPAGLRNALVGSNLNTVISTTGASLAKFYGAASLASLADITVVGRLAGLVSSQTSTNTTASFSFLRRVNAVSSLVVSGTLTSVANHRMTAASSLAATAPGVGAIRQSTTIVATTLPGFPYYLPIRFGVVINALTSSALANNNTASASLQVTAVRNQSVGQSGTIATSLGITFVTDYPGFPYTLPFLVGRLNTTANISALLQATQAVTPSALTSGKLAGLLAGSLSAFSGASSVALQRTRADSSLLALAGTTSAGRLSGLLSSVTAVSSTISAASLSRIILSGSLGVTSSPITAGLRNAIVNSATNVVSVTSGNKRLSAFASAVLPLSVNELTSVTEILASVGNSSGEVTASTSAEITRRTNASASLLVSASLTPVVRWQAKFSASLGAAVLATGLSKLSTTIVATTLPGFPYYLPIRFGVAINVSTSSTLSSNNTASASLAVNTETNQSLGIRTAISTSLAISFITDYPGFPYTLPFKVGKLNATVNVLVSLQASQGITSGTTSSGRISGLLSGSLAVSSASNFSLLRNARVNSSLSITATTDGAGRLNGILSSGSLVSSEPVASSRASMRFSAALAATPLPSATGLRNALVSSSRAVTAAPTAYAVYSTPITAVLSRFPYYLPVDFGVVFRATTTSTVVNSISSSTNPTAVTANITAATRASLSATPSLAALSIPTALAKQQTSFAASLPVNSLSTALFRGQIAVSATTLPGFPYYLPMRFGVAFDASTTATLINANIASASLNVAANRNQSLSVGTKIATALSVNFVTDYPGFPYSLPLLLGRLNSRASVSTGVSSTTPISFSPSASAKQNFSASASRQINVSRPANVVGVENISARLIVKSALVPCFPYDLPLILSSAPNAQASMSRNQKLDTQLQINSLRSAQLGINTRAAASLVVNFVTVHQVIPYTLPFLLGNLNTSFTLNRSAQSSSAITAGIQSLASLGQMLSATRVITASRDSSVSRGHFIQTRLLTVKNAIVPCFPYDLPLLLSSEPNARASALRNARVDASLVTNAQRPTNIGILVKGSVSLAVTATTNNQTLPYTLPYLLGYLDTRASLSRIIQTTLLGQATGTANSSQNQKLSVARQINVALTAAGSRDALVAASLSVKSTTVPSFPYYLPFELNTVSVQQASASRITRASANTIAVGVRGMSSTFMPGFPFILPFRIGLTAPSPRMSLGTRVSSSTSISTTLSAEVSRKLFALSSVTISATTQSTLSGKTTFASYLAVGATQTPELNVFPYEFPYQFATYRSEPPRATLVVSSRISSTTLAVTARTYGFPYQLPINLGPVNSAKLTKFISAQTTINATASALLLEAGAAHVVFSVLASRPASARLRSNIVVNSRPGFPFTLPLLLQGASFDVTASRPATLGFVRLASSQTNVVSSRSALIYANHVGRAQISASAQPTANAKFSVAISSSLGVTGIITALSKYRIRLAAPLTVSPISFVQMNFRTRISSPLEVQSGLAANATFDTVLSAPLTASATTDTVLSEVSRNAASLSVTATRIVSGLRDTKASASTSVSATTNAAMFLAAKAVGVLPVAVSLSAETRATGRVLVSLGTSSEPVATLLQRSAISAPRNISFSTNTVINQYQKISTTVNSLADLLSVVTKDQKIGAPTSVTLAGIFSSILRSVTATTQPVIVASRSTVARGDFLCGTQAGITVQPSIQVRWAAYVDINSLDVAAGLDISGSRGQFLVSIGTAVSATATAKAEPYHSAGTFLPFFYAGSTY